jgi:hypothetical protein
MVEVACTETLEMTVEITDAQDHHHHVTILETTVGHTVNATATVTIAEMNVEMNVEMTDETTAVQVADTMGDVPIVEMITIDAATDVKTDETMVTYDQAADMAAVERREAIVVVVTMVLVAREALIDALFLQRPTISKKKMLKSRSRQSDLRISPSGRLPNWLKNRRPKKLQQKRTL